MEDRKGIPSKGKEKSNQQQAQPPQAFLFIDSSKPAQGSRQGRRNARSFVMQRARRERPWSTSKNAGKQASARRSSDSASVGTPDAPLTQPTTPQTPADLPSVGDIEYAQYGSYTDNSVFLSKQTVCIECQIFTCQPGQSLCPRCILLPPSTSFRTAGIVSEGLLDPFGSFPVEVDSRVSELLTHFLSVMSPGTIAVDIRHQSDLIRTDWFGRALGNSAFMHSLLCAAAVHLYIVGKGSYFSIVYHKAQAVAAINAALSDPELGISDANIAAVFNLLCVEESLLLPFFHDETSGDGEEPNQRMIHLNGLRRMVELRGGLRAIRTHRCLQAFILWSYRHSTAHAIASFEPPYLSPLDPTHSSRNPNSSAYRPGISQHFINLCRAANVRDSLIELVDDLLNFAADLNAWFEDPACPLDPLDIQNHSSVLECLFLRWLRNDSNTESVRMPIEEALCIALLIFVVGVSEAVSPNAEPHYLHFPLSKRLQDALRAICRQDWMSCPDLLLWILSIGAIATLGAQDFSWFIRQLTVACGEFGIASSCSLIERLEQCVWVGFKLNPAAKRLWDEISLLRLEDRQHLPLRVHTHT
ncbi:uncharacterized protein BDZ99DRAFT_539601 [Mytilinidion resinicola]|uniref:Uncharacterized protein n=1 Tax=Mytilinidion resinicola TaxID=574789 RepID=A0A6A6YE22_9PEZI|nr:uncharacterized protein BDZ99DRAFT_539601 [Mytilinidion resinicola]KAF2806097.1 hypothetical protein BDZ99DRAFT_539601 [Mytilinidion resinicola]